MYSRVQTPSDNNNIQHRFKVERKPNLLEIEKNMDKKFVNRIKDMTKNFFAR